MLTSVTTFDPATGVTTKRSLVGASHGHWAVHRAMGGWGLQWAFRQGMGTSYLTSWPAHRGFATRKEAEAKKRELRAARIEGWDGPPPAPEVP